MRITINTKAIIHLTTPQWEVLSFLQRQFGYVWIGNFNKKVVQSLLEKGLVELSELKDNVKLTEAGINWLNNQPK